jgi:hypothetical protein
MGYIKANQSLVGKIVSLTKEKQSLAGRFTIGSMVKITEENPQRGYTFEDSEGNRVIEAGFDGFKVIE